MKWDGTGMARGWGRWGMELMGWVRYLVDGYGRIQKIFF